MTTMQQWTRTMAQRLRTSCSNIASCHAQNIRQLCQTLSLSWLRIISHAASSSISWRTISSHHSTEVTRASFHHTFMIDHALWFFIALTESPTAHKVLSWVHPWCTVRRASLKLRRQVDIDMRSTLERTQMKRCLHAHVKIGYIWHQLPCKHFAVFQHKKEWQWEQSLLTSQCLPLNGCRHHSLPFPCSRWLNQLSATVAHMTAWTLQRT